MRYLTATGVEVDIPADYADSLGGYTPVDTSGQESTEDPERVKEALTAEQADHADAAAGGLAAEQADHADVTALPDAEAAVAAQEKSARTGNSRK